MNSKRKILTAADELAREIGPAHMSLEAVACRAGVSKGGLLYHFPSKSRLLEALVETHLADLEEELGRADGDGDGEGDPAKLLGFYLELFLREHERCKPPPGGLMAALAENPDLLAPVRRFNRSLVDRITAGCGDPALATIVFLALEGVRSMEMLNVDVLRQDEFTTVIERLKALSAEAA